MNKAFDRIVQENSSYYVLGYYSTNEKRDGRLRRISVKVNGYPDAQVTFRKNSPVLPYPTVSFSEPSDYRTRTYRPLVMNSASPAWA